MRLFISFLLGSVLVGCGGSSGSPGPTVPVETTSNPVVSPDVVPAQDNNPTDAEPTPPVDTSDGTLSGENPFVVRESLVEPASTLAELELLTAELRSTRDLFMDTKALEQMSEIYQTINDGLPSSTDERQLRFDAEMFDKLTDSCELEFSEAGAITFIDCGTVAAFISAAKLLLRHPVYDEVEVGVLRHDLNDDGTGGFASRVIIRNPTVPGQDWPVDKLSLVESALVNAVSGENSSQKIKIILDPPDWECEIGLDPFEFEALNINECSAAVKESIAILNRLMQ